MKTLPIIETQSYRTLASPTNKVKRTPNTLAIEVFTDFEEVEPLYVDPDYPADRAISLLNQLKRPLLMVATQNQLVGVVNKQSLNNQEIIKKVAEGYDRSEMTVGEFLQPFPIAIEYADFARASISDIMLLMSDRCRDCCVVVDSDEKVIRGIISSMDIAAQIGVEPPETRKSTQIIELSSHLYKQVNPRANQPLSSG